MSVSDTVLTDGESSEHSLVAGIVASYVSYNPLPAAELPGLITTVFKVLKNLAAPEVELPLEQKPAVPVRKSITADYLICLEDGKKLKTLKRHLRTSYGLSPDDYRAKWKLAADYPMVAPNYAEARSAMAKSIGLGRKAAPVPAPAPEPPPMRRRRSAKAAAA